MATPVPTPSSPSPSAPSTPAPSPSSDRGAAENPATREAVIANYFAALNAAQAERAWELLSPSAQAQTRPRELEGAAAATRSIAVTRAEAVTSRVNEAVYRVTLAATPNPEDPSNWSAGPNVRRVRLDRTPSGRRIDEIAGSPIPDSPSAPTPDSAWKRVAIPDVGLSVEVPTGWSRSGVEWEWAGPSGGELVGVTWGDVGPGWEPRAMLPNHGKVSDPASIDLGWAIGTFYNVEVTDSAASGGGIRAYETHTIVRLGSERAVDFVATAGTADALGRLQPIARHLAESVHLPGG
jgi:hypothetical protein